MKALEILMAIDRKSCTDRTNGILDLAIKELEELENRSCKNCKSGFDCNIFKKLWKEKLKKDGYLMSRKEFDCRFWESK